ncbi:hypothetical protein VTG60DRAFT_2444 [Thermothelomyces hinnuleus]
MAILEFPGKKVPLDANQQSKLRKTFFPPLMLLDSLNAVCPSRGSGKASDAPPNPNQSLEEMFHTLVNKLAQICDFEPKGNTITALAILRQNGRICYVLASNRRKTGALRNARAGLQAVLDILKSNLEADQRESDETVERRLLQEILRRNTVRVRAYLTALAKELPACIKRCNVTSQEGRRAKEALEKLQSMIPDQSQYGQKSDQYINATIQCIRTIEENRNSPLQRFIEARAVEDDTMAKGGCWSMLQHVAGRLLSYKYAAQTFVHAHHLWADSDLFRDFDVESLRSSEGYPADALKLNSETAEAIINRVPGCAPERVLEYKKHAAELQRSYDVDGMLEQQWREKKLEPVVHAEMLLHDWLSRTEGGTQPSRFFQNWQYIGTSKPVCRLCQDYFHVVATPVRFRSGHPNTYLNWRLPDVYVPDDRDEAAVEAARRAWCEVLGQMKGRVYAALVRVLEEKVSDRKPLDSNTFTDRITGIGDPTHLANWLATVRI